MRRPHIKRTAGACLAAVSAITLIADATLASAQPAPPYDSGQYNNDQNPPPGDQNGPPPGDQYNGPPPGDVAPPPGQRAEPPPGYDDRGNNAYDDHARQADEDYAARYSQWAAQYCVDQRNQNTAAGAIIGGVLGAVVGAGVAGRGDRGAGAFVGGALGAGAGAAIGSSSSSANCPPGYVVRSGAPAFAYGYGYAPAYAYGPGWYQPWFWSGGRWVYRPYRSWYWRHPAYWRPGFRGRPYRYRDRW